MQEPTKKTVFLVIPRRISVRYTLSAGLLDELKRQGNPKVVILTSIQDPKFAEEFSGPDVCVEYIPMRDGKESFLERLLRQVRNYLGGIGYNLETFAAKAKMRGWLFFAVYRLATILLRSFVFLRGWLRAADTYMFSYLSDGYYEKLFEKYHPDLVVIHSVYELTAVPVARVAKRKNVPSLGIVISWDNLTNKADIYARCGKLAVWNDVMRQQAVKYHQYRPEEVAVIGTTQFDAYMVLDNEIETKERFFERKKLNADKKLIVYTTSPERIGGKTEVEAMRLIYDKMCAGGQAAVQMLVRVYTKDSIDRYGRLSGLPGLVLDDPRDIFKGQVLSYKEQDKRFVLDLAAAMKYADVVVNLDSTITLDAAIFDVPVVNLAFGKLKFWSETSHYRHLVETGGARLAFDAGQLVSQISAYLGDRSTDRENRKRLVEKLCGPIDGRRTRELAEYILDSLT